VMFAIEELAGAPEKRNSGLLIAGIVLAGLVSVSINGNATYFGVIHVTQVGWSTLLPGMLVAVLSGLSGGLFSRLLIASLNGQSRDRFSQLRARKPIVFACACGLAIATIGVITHGITFGSGYAHTRMMLDGAEEPASLYVALKFVATWLTTWSGVPGGIFAPSLAIGAALGNDVAQLLHFPQATILIALGMAGFLAAATQAPLTSFIIVMEMVDGHAMVLSLMACALIASAISRIISRPLYGTLASLVIMRSEPTRPR
jgi:H+/Cl- antiporter ClcA